MEYNNEYETDRRRSDMDRDRERMPDRRTEQNRMGMDKGTEWEMPSHGGIGRSNPEKEKMTEELYLKLDERMAQALAFHEQLADYFCFLNLQGFKRMLEYQYMKECAEKRKLHRHYIDAHRKILPTRQAQLPVFIPREWSRYTKDDINDSVLPKFVRAALNEYEKWEEETKEVLEEICERMNRTNMVADCEYVKDMILDVEKELKKIDRMKNGLNGTGYDVNMIHSIQDKYHEKYKKKYDDHYTTKNNYRPYPYSPYEEDDDDEPEDAVRRRRRRIGYMY